MSRIYAYARTSTAEQSTLSQINEIKEAYPDIEDRRIFIDAGVSGTVPCLEREQFSEVYKHIDKGDTLVVWWLDRLGRDYQDAKETALALLKTGVVIKTINQNMTFAYTGATMSDSFTDNMLIMLTALAAAEKENRRASQDAGRAALKANGQWNEKYKGKPANKEMHEAITAELILGQLSMQKIADKLGSSLATVKRVKKQYLEANK